MAGIKGKFYYADGFVSDELVENHGELVRATGSKKAAMTNQERHGEDFYANIGRKGGQNGHTGGFFANRELAREAGRRGGRISRRGPAKTAKKINVVSE
jgi:general stress protein YciG